MSDWQARLVAWLVTIPILAASVYLGQTVDPDLMVFPGLFVMLVVGASVYILLRTYYPEKPKSGDEASGKDTQEL